MSDGGAETAEISPESKPTPLYRGIWIESIENGQLLPVGGSIFDDRPTLSVRVDYNSFDSDLENYAQKITDHYEANKQHIVEWLKSVGTDIDPYLFYACQQALLKMEALLQVNRDEHDEPARRKLYSGDSAPNLSDLKGKAACAEQAALGKHLLKLMGVESTYMSGVTMEDPENPNPEDHSFLILKENDKPDSIIFDIARPKTQHNLPRLLRTDFPLTAEVFKGKKHDLVRGTDILDKKQLYYGVGHPMLDTEYTVLTAA